MRFLLILITGLAALLITPGEALAWGPGVHTVTANWVLQNLTALPPAVADVLMRYPGFFIQGCLSADIFIGKGSVAKKGHSHNWDAGFTLLARAVKDRDKAYAYGYLAHLAADTVAHNVFVPGLFEGAPGSGRLAHVYLEIQADRILRWDSRDARGVFHQQGSRRANVLLRDSMSQKAFRFWLKTHVFEGSIALGGSKVWRGSMRLFDRLLPEQLRRQLVEQMLTISTRAVISVLNDFEKSPVMSLDPIGADALATAMQERNGKSVLLRGVADKIRRAVAGTGTPALTEKLEEPTLIIPEALAAFPPVCTTNKGM